MFQELINVGMSENTKSKSLIFDNCGICKRVLQKALVFKNDFAILTHGKTNLQIVLLMVERV